MIEHWEKLGSEYLGDFRIFRIRADTSRSPRTGQDYTFFVLESPDWINVIPLTPEGKVVMIYQYRHGTEDVTLEVPGGMVDPADGDPSVSAARELREETGYEAAEIIHLGSVAPNPAFLDNRCHSYLAINAHRVADIQLDGAEDIAFVEIPLAEIPDLIRAGKITHSLTIAAFYYLELYERDKKLTQSPRSEDKAQKEDIGDMQDKLVKMVQEPLQRPSRDQPTQLNRAIEIPENMIAKQVVDAAYHIHKRLGPGLLESAYEAVLVHELRSRGLEVKQQVILPMVYGAFQIEAAYRIDLLIEDKVIVELKSVETIIPVYQKQLLTYLKLADKRLGLLLNFGADTIKQGIKRVVNGLPG